MNESIDLKVLVCDVSELENKRLFDKLYSFVSESRRKKIDKCRIDSDKRLSLGVGILETLMLAYEKIECADDCIITDFYGKAHIVGHPELHYNLSHSGTKAMCAYMLSDKIKMESDTVGVGCDVEKSDRFRMNVAKQFFSESEYRAICECENDESRKIKFCRFWTLKESYIKALGKGLRKPLNSFSLNIDGPTVLIDDRDENDFCIFWEPDLSDGYRYACCVTAPKGLGNISYKMNPINLLEIAESVL